MWTGPRKTEKLNPGQISAFRDPATDVLLGVEHEKYPHIAIVKGDVRKALAEDFSAVN